MVCIFCERNEVDAYFSKWCEKCHRLKRLMSIYGDNVHEVCETVFVRNPKQQQHKIDHAVMPKNLKMEIEEAETHNYNLRNKL